MKTNQLIKFTKIGVLLLALGLISFSLESCRQDPCEFTTCLNGGVCIGEGQCDCPVGYTGLNCGQQDTPIRVRITRIVVHRFPATDGGSAWDVTSSGADIYPVIQLGNVIIYDSSTFIEDASPSSTHTFNPPGGINLESVNSQHLIVLWDFDTFDDDDYIGGFSFRPYTSTGGFPEVVEMTGTQLSIDLHLDYVF